MACALILCQEPSAAFDSRHEHAKITGDAPRMDLEVAIASCAQCFHGMRMILCQEPSAALDSRHEHAKITGDAPRADKDVAIASCAQCFHGMPTDPVSGAISFGFHA